MTVKRNGERVVLKDGKVSCSCCEGPSECCMYPSQALFDGLYTYEDLPDTVLGTGIPGDNNIVMSRLNPPQPSIDIARTSYYRGTSTSGLLVGIGLRDGDGDEWVGSEVANEGAGFGQCLISRFPTSSPNGIGDQFADTYTVTYLPNPLPGQQSISVTVSRTSLCVWEGLDGCGRPWYLIYGDSIFGAGSAYIWKVAMAIDEGNPCDDFVQQPQEKNSNEFNNTPVGNYTQGDYPASVS